MGKALDGRWQSPNKGRKRNAKGKEIEEIKFVDFGIEQRQVVGFWEGRGMTLLRRKILEMNDDLWGTVGGLSSKIWKRCERRKTTHISFELNVYYTKKFFPSAAICCHLLNLVSRIQQACTRQKTDACWRGRIFVARLLLE